MDRSLVGFEGKLKAVGAYQGFGESDLPLTLCYRGLQAVVEAECFGEELQRRSNGSRRVPRKEVSTYLAFRVSASMH